VKLMRSADTFTASISADGSFWTQVGSPVTVPMARTVFAGLTVTAHNNSKLNTATFAGVSVAAQTPVAPAGLHAVAGSAQIALSWASAPGAASYSVWRSTTNAGPYAVVATSILDTNWFDASIANGTTYYYVVTAVNANGESGPSNQASAAAPLPSLSVFSSGTNITLSWPRTASSFTLYTTTNLSLPAFWSRLTNAAVNQNNTLTVILPANDSASYFFRLAVP
jgi:hypothetical protein